MFHYVRIIDSPAADEVAHFVKYHSIVADGQRQRVAFAGIGIRNQHVTAVTQLKAMQFGSCVRKIGLDRLAPGPAVIGRKGAIEVSAFAVIPEQCHQVAVRKHPPERLFGCQFTGGAQNGVRLPLIDRFYPAYHKVHALFFVVIGPPGRHPLAGRDFFGREVINRIVIDNPQIFPALLLRIPTEGVQFEARPEKAGCLVQRGQRQQFALPQPESATDPPKAFIGSCSVVFRIFARIGRRRRHKLRFAPFQSICTRCELHPLPHLILNSRPVAPHRPELSIVVDQVIVLVDAISVPDVADDYVLAGDLRKAVKIDLARVIRYPFRPKHYFGRRILCRIRIIGRFFRRRRIGAAAEEQQAKGGKQEMAIGSFLFHKNIG